MHASVPLARVAGLLYLLMCLLGASAHLVVRAVVHVPGDAVTTTANLVASAGAFRLALVADIAMATAFALLGVVLHRLLRAVDRSAATAMLVFVGVGAGMILANLGFHHAALVVATEPSVAAGVGADPDGLVLLLLDLHHHGYRLAGIFFGLWLLPLGALAVRSRGFPRWLGTALVVAGAAWVLDTMIGFAVPGLPAWGHTLLTLPTLAEFAMVIHLLVWGIRTPLAVTPGLSSVGAPAAIGDRAQ